MDYVKYVNFRTTQIIFILHIQGVFNLPGRDFRQRITSTSSVPMTLNDVIVHVRQFVIAFVSLGGWSGFPDPDGFLDMPDSSVGFLVYNFHSLSVDDVVFCCISVAMFFSNSRTTVSDTFLYICLCQTFCHINVKGN